MPRKLKDIDVAEISLVDSAANRKKFFIKKRRINMDLAKLLESMIDEKDEHQPILLKLAKGEDLTDEDIAKAKEVPEKDFKGTKGALNILQKYVDVYPPDYLDAIRTLIKKAIYGEVEVDSGDGETEISNEDLIKELADMEKAGARLSKATIAQLQKIIDNASKFMLERMVELGEKKGDNKEKLSAETVAKLEKLAVLEKTEKERIEKEKEDKENTRDKEIADLKKMVEELKKKKPVRKSVEGQEGDDEDEDKDKENDNKWPSLTGQSEED